MKNIFILIKNIFYFTIFKKNIYFLKKYIQFSTDLKHERGTFSTTLLDVRFNMLALWLFFYYSLISQTNAR